MVDPAIRRRGGDPDAAPKTPHERAESKLERELEEGLEETMAGSDPVSVTQPTHSPTHEGERRPKDDHSK